MNIIIQGVTGAGKTALGSAIALNICKAGINVRCYRWCDLVDEIMLRALDTKATLMLQKLLCRHTVLMIDDFGLQGKMPGCVKDMLYKVMDNRWREKLLYLQVSSTSKDIFHLIDEGAQGNAIIDRIMNPSKAITLNGESIM